MRKDPAHLSGYRLMWIFVMFDLPVGSKKEMRDATKFREFLLDQGFEMSQFSIYARFCNGKDSYESHLKRIEGNLPEKGEIHVLTFTDKQYEGIVRLDLPGKCGEHQLRNQEVFYGKRKQADAGVSA